MLVTHLWGGWEEFGNKQEILEEYIEYYNTVKKSPSDFLNRTPREISSGITSINTQRRLKIRLIRKQYGQVSGRKAMMKQIQNHTVSHPLITVPDLSEMCVR